MEWSHAFVVAGYSKFIFFPFLSMNFILLCEFCVIYFPNAMHRIKELFE